MLENKIKRTLPNDAKIVEYDLVHINTGYGVNKKQRVKIIWEQNGERYVSYISPSDNEVRSIQNERKRYL